MGSNVPGAEYQAPQPAFVEYDAQIDEVVAELSQDE